MARPPIGVFGKSGTGKSSMFETLPPEKTCILNTECKPLPMRNFGKFNNIDIRAFKALDSTLTALTKPEMVKKYDYVILESFTSMTEMIWRYSEKVNTGWDIPSEYNNMIMDIIVKLKKLQQQVFIVAIPEQKAEGYGETKEYARVKGKELKYGYLEKELAIVLFTNPQYAEEDIPKEGIEEGEMTEVYLDYKSNKRNSAKAPRGLFKEKPVNDAKFIADAIAAFYDS